MKYGEHIANGPGDYFRPFGQDSGEAAYQAQGLSHWLSQDADWHSGKGRHWLLADHSALTFLVRFSGLVPQLAADEQFDLNDRRMMNNMLDGQLSALHAALPFNDQERRFIVGMHQPVTPETEVAASAIRKQSAELVSSGVRRAVKGRDLMRRWWEWRRGIGAYEGTGSVLAAAMSSMDLALLLEAGGYSENHARWR